MVVSDAQACAERLRESAPGLVADRDGRVGYGAYAPDFLRGLFDLWMRIHCHRDALGAAVGGRLRGRLTRVLLRPTPAYAEALDPFAGAAPDLRGYVAAERAQLRRGDVPYFYTRLDRPAPGSLDHAVRRAAEAVSATELAAAHRVLELIAGGLSRGDAV